MNDFKFLTNHEKRYYTCNEKKFYSKYTAINESRKTNKHFEFIVNPLFYSWDFSKEPTDSWATILKNHAHEIRDNFKTIRLWYSGGIDSDLILDTFIQNNIHLDEIHINMQGVPGADYEQQIAIARLNKIQNKLKKTKIIIHQIDEKSFLNHVKKRNWTFEGVDRPSRTFRYLTNPLGNEEFNPELIDLYGNYKPDLVYFNNQWYAYYLDNECEIELGKKGYKHFFYQDCPEITIKQNHMIKNYVEENFPKSKWNEVCIQKVKHQHVINQGSGRLLYTQNFLPKSMFTDKTPPYQTVDGNTYYFSNNKDYKSFEIARKDPKLWLAYKEFGATADFVSKEYEEWLVNGRIEHFWIASFDKVWSLEKNEYYRPDQLWPNGFDSNILINSL